MIVIGKEQREIEYELIIMVSRPKRRTAEEEVMCVIMRLPRSLRLVRETAQRDTTLHFRTSLMQVVLRI